MTKYNHAFDMGFEVISNHPEGEDVTPEMFKTALEKRIVSLMNNDEMVEAVGCPFDTFEIGTEGE